MVCIIAANPDAGGVGVRMAVYIQSLLPAIGLLVEIIRGRSIAANTKLRINNAQAATSSLLTGMGLIISAIIQHKLYGLSTFHALVVLNLCWVTLIGGFQGTLPLKEGENTWRPEIEKCHRKLYAVLSIKLSMMAGFGWWVMHNPAGYDSAPDACASSTVFWVLGRHPNVTSKPFRTVLLTMYPLLTVPVFNIGVIVAALWLIIVIIGYLLMYIGQILEKCRAPASITKILTDDNGPSVEALVISLVAFVDGMFILTTEMTIQLNTIGSDERAWGLGQTLPVLVALLPATSIIYHMVTRGKFTENDEEAASTPQSVEKGSTSAQTDLEAQAPPKQRPPSFPFL
ncbi:hypothetical protein DL93DRAFT_1522797 [Clavulina sp. PMI_390]|nr:hypothetical protein DL93DRAFT_1522797 [Clavulina sp. PMI_390]